MPGDGRVRGSNNSGLWNEEGAAVEIVVSPPYWATWWFRGLAGLGLIGSAIILAQIGPRLIGVNLPAACKEYEEQMGGGGASSEPGISSAYRGVALRGYRVDEGSSAGQVLGLDQPPIRTVVVGVVDEIRVGDPAA